MPGNVDIEALAYVGVEVEVAHVGVEVEVVHAVEVEAEVRAGPPTSPPPATSASETSVPPPKSQTTQSLSDQLKVMRSARQADKKNLNVPSVEQRATLTESEAMKQVARYLLPDAPPRKQNRKTSPTRVPCPLLPGVPETPPPRILQDWQKKKESLPVPQELQPKAASGPSGYVDGSDDDDDFNESSVNGCPNISTSSTGIRFVKDLDPNLHIVECQIELVGFTPNDDLGSGTENADREPEDQIDDGFTGRRSLETEPLPSELALFLDEADTRDDIALREVASGPDMLHFEWSDDPEKFVGQQETFTGEAGPTFSVEGLSPVDVFERIWDHDIMQLIVRESNRYGRQIYTNDNKIWSDLEVSDIWVFFALLMLQSILILPVEREYWYPCLALLKVGDFSKIMPYKKFIKIKKCLHFVDNSIVTVAATEDSKLKKIWPIVTHLNHKFGSLYQPEQYIAIDESLLLWKGRLSFAQRIATKAAQVGVKSYELCESRTGYLWKMLIYTGKGDKPQPASDAANNDEPEGATSKIVYDLVRPLLGKGHTLVMDNFYNSPLLSRTLKAKKTDTMGTLRLKREFVPDDLRNLNKTNMRVGEVVYSQTEDLTISVWHDANVVALISTFHKSIVGGKVKYGIYKYKPQVVLDYNMTMGGVDKKDQMLQAFPLERSRNLAWYKKLFRRLLNVSIYNAFVIHNHQKSGNQRQFRVALAQQILDKAGKGQSADPRAVMPRTGHFPTRSIKRGRCRICNMKNIDKRASFKCDTCNVCLCMEGCFREYHLRLL